MVLDFKGEGDLTVDRVRNMQSSLKERKEEQARVFVRERTSSSERSANPPREKKRNRQSDF